MNKVKPCFAELWPAYLDEKAYKCACCGKPIPPGHQSVVLDGQKPDGMHYIYQYTKENRVGNGVNYDPYNLPKEDPEGGIFTIVVGEQDEDEGMHWLNFCRNCWPTLTDMSPEEIYAEYSNNINSSRNSKKTGRRLNSSLVDTFVRYHDDPDNYRSNSVGFDKLYDRLRTYAKPGEVAEDMNVDELFVRATPQEQEEMVRLITPNRFNSSRRNLNSSYPRGKTTFAVVQDMLTPAIKQIVRDAWYDIVDKSIQAAEWEAADSDLYDVQEHGVLTQDGVNKAEEPRVYEMCEDALSSLVESIVYALTYYLM